MIKGIHHPGISVRNLDRAVEFYCGMLGMEMEGQGNFGSPAMDNITALSGTGGRAAMLRAGSQHVELFEFATPVPKSGDPLRPVCDHGITHFCVLIDDVQSEYARLKAAGVVFHCEPQPFRYMNKNAQATYLRDPDGNVIELLEIPD